MLNSTPRYSFVAGWIQNIVKISDQQTLECSKLTRFPNAIRAENKKRQTLLKVNPRVSANLFLSWLKQNEFAKLIAI
jgi:hypothetical protein